MKNLSGKKWAAPAIIFFNLLLTVLFCLMQVAGVDPLEGAAWHGYPPGPGMQVGFAWDVFRIALSRFEPASALLKDVQLRDSPLWTHHFLNPEVPFHANKVYDARLPGVCNV